MAEAPNERFSERHGVLIKVDHDICAGFAECVAVAPEVFALDDKSQSVILDPDASTLEMLEEAADVCPVTALLLFDESGAQVAPKK